MKEPAVTNSTCLISLESIGQLSLLPALFEPIVIPPGVQQEFGSAADWLKVQAPVNDALVATLAQIVDEGEAEAIALALERRALLILDDRKARQWAKRLRVRVVGTVGLLIRAKRQGFLDAVKPHLNALRVAGFHLSQALEEEALRLANE